MQDRFNTLLSTQRQILSVYLTAGFPERDDTALLCKSLARAGVDMIEIGIPFSDPVADGPVIQASNQRALGNGMNLSLLMEQLRSVRHEISIPILLMGYFNPILQFGIERFLTACREAGVAGLIIPDLPLEEYTRCYATLFASHGIGNVLLATTRTSNERLREIDSLAPPFIYLVSSPGPTGGALNVDHEKRAELSRISTLGLARPLFVGFGISTHAHCKFVWNYASGCIIGSAFIRAIATAQNLEAATMEFVQEIRAGEEEL